MRIGLFHASFIKMCFSSTYEKDFNERIERLADELVRNMTLNDFVNKPAGDVKQFFLANQKLINSSIGDQRVQDDLFKLAGMTTDPNLAHMIAAKATGAMPLPSGMSFVNLPKEIQQLIFSQMSAAQLNLVSKQINVNVKDNLKDLGCKTAKEAVEYVIHNQLIAADLSAFDDFDKMDLEILSKYSELERLSLNTRTFSQNKSYEVGANFKKLKSLSIVGWSSTVGAWTTTEYLIGFEAEKSLDNLKNLQHLAMPRNQLFYLNGNPNIQTLEFFAVDKINIKEVDRIMIQMPNLKKLYLPKRLLVYDAQKIAQNHPNLQIIRR